MRAVLPLLPVALALSLVTAAATVGWRAAERGELPVLHLGAGR
ncbi:hypothetical protein [Methylobacterium oxalidis]|nr:hypothetical protein [Methylobacterium oxalidis]GJE35015.1 hypothetical protein LDDCCGHA_5232 [Methylobacterium oxalidis]